MTIVLILLLTYLYTLVTISEFFQYTEFTDSNGDCEDVAACLATAIDAIRQGGIGTILAPSHGTDDRILRIVFDTSYFILVSVVLINMVLGIIIDAFAELRKQTEDMDERVNNVCYICCLDRRTLESGVAGGFDHHRGIEHNPFSYFYFLMSLREKRDSGEQLSGVENFVEERVAAGDSSFFPTYQAMGLKHRKSKSADEQLLHRLGRLKAGTLTQAGQGGRVASFPAHCTSCLHAV